MIGNIDAMFTASALQRTRLFRDQKVDDIACGRLCRFWGTEGRPRCLTETVITDPIIEAMIGCIEESRTISECSYRATSVIPTARRERRA